MLIGKEAGAVEDIENAYVPSGPNCILFDSSDSTVDSGEQKFN